MAKKCWFCGQSEKECEYLIESRPMMLDKTFITETGKGKISLKGRIKCHICESCVQVAGDILWQNKKGESESSTSASIIKG